MEAQTAKELAERARNGEMTYSSAGVGSATHWAAERLRLAGDFKGTHVPFRGASETNAAVLGGHVTAQADSSGWAPLGGLLVSPSRIFALSTLCNSARGAPAGRPQSTTAFSYAGGQGTPAGSAWPNASPWTRSCR